MCRLSSPQQSVRLARRWRSDRFVELPNTPTWTATTDSSGGALIHAPAGAYELLIDAGSPIGRGGIIQIRSHRNDSLHAYIRLPALC